MFTVVTYNSVFLFVMRKVGKNNSFIGPEIKVSKELTRFGFAC